MTVSNEKARRANSSYSLMEATGVPTVSGTVVLFPTSTTTPVLQTLFPNMTYRIISKETAINYSLGRSTWTQGGHRCAFLPAGLYEVFHTTNELFYFGVTLASGEAAGSDVYLTQLLSSDTTNSYLSLDLLGQ